MGSDKERSIRKSMRGKVDGYMLIRVANVLRYKNTISAYNNSANQHFLKREHPILFLLYNALVIKNKVEIIHDGTQDDKR
jgi:hypothetical protein